MCPCTSKIKATAALSKPTSAARVAPIDVARCASNDPEDVTVVTLVCEIEGRSYF